MSNEFHQNPRYFKDLSMWAVRAPSKELAVMMHAAILASPDLRTTAKRLNPVLDVSPMDNPVIKPLEFTLVMSATQFETKEKGLLPPSVVMMGKDTYDVKDYVKAKFPTVAYVDLVFPGPDGPKSIIKTAWVLPIAAQTASTGTLADFLRTLGATVTEVDLDAEDGDSDEEDKQDGNALVDDEAEEEEKEE